MSGYTHRDRRAHRDVGRAFWAVVGVSVGLTGLALAIPVPLVGIATVVALGLLGAAYLGWSERMLGSYSDDLRRVREGTETDGFARVEAASEVGLDRDQDSVRSRSPHARRRPVAASSDERGAPLSSGSDSDQA